MAIKNDQFLKELQPFSRMTVVPGITVGDLNFASAQSVFSTGYIKPSANDTFAANSEVDLFQAAIGDNGQGLAAGQVMTRSQTNWIDSQGRLPANEVFIGIRCLVSCFKHTNASAAATSGVSFDGVAGVFSKQAPITDVAALWAIVHAFSWEYQTGDGIIRNVGQLAAYPQGGGVWQSSQPFTAAIAAPAAVGSAQNAIAAQNGSPCPSVATELPIPFMFLPNITTRVKVKNGSALSVEPTTSVAGSTFDIDGVGTADYLAIKMTFQGYKLTMPV